MLDCSDASMVELKSEMCGVCRETTDTASTSMIDLLYQVSKESKVSLLGTKHSNDSIYFGFNS